MLEGVKLGHVDVREPDARVLERGLRRRGEVREPRPIPITRSASGATWFAASVPEMAPPSDSDGGTAASPPACVSATGIPVARRTREGHRPPRCSGRRRQRDHGPLRLADQAAAAAIAFDPAGCAGSTRPPANISTGYRTRRSGCPAASRGRRRPSRRGGEDAHDPGSAVIACSGRLMGPSSGRPVGTRRWRWRPGCAATELLKDRSARARRRRRRP